MKNMHNEHTDVKWESGELGASEEHVRKVSAEEEKAVDDALDLQVISIRLQKALIEQFKALAKHEGIGYQPLMRQVLTHYAHDAMKPHKHLKFAR
jgi:predicted DNA binding CopG/RHH family protein